MERVCSSASSAPQTHLLSQCWERNPKCLGGTQFIIASCASAKAEARPGSTAAPRRGAERVYPLFTGAAGWAVSACLARDSGPVWWGQTHPHLTCGAASPRAAENDKSCMAAAPQPADKARHTPDSHPNTVPEAASPPCPALSDTLSPWAGLWDRSQELPTLGQPGSPHPAARPPCTIHLQLHWGWQGRRDHQPMQTFTHSWLVPAQQHSPRSEHRGPRHLRSSLERVLWSCAP